MANQYEEFRGIAAHDMHFIDTATAVQPAESESKLAPNVAAPSQAVSLLAAEKQTLEKMANGAGLSEVLNDLCASIDAHGSPVASMVCLLDGEWLSPCAGPHVPPHLRLPSHWRSILTLGESGEIEARLRRFDGCKRDQAGVDICFCDRGVEESLKTVD